LTAEAQPQSDPPRPDAELSISAWGPGAVIAFGAVLIIGATQGGYFPPTWGIAAMLLAIVVCLWLAAGARTDAGWPDVFLVTALGLFATWIGLSTWWSTAPSNSVLEAERALVVLSGVSAILVLARRGTQVYIAFATMLAIAGIGGYSLLTRLFPHGRHFDPIQGYRLAGPVGYYNGLGILMTLGIILALGVAFDARWRWQRLVGAVALVVLLPTLYFTFSRGAWLALGLGLAVLFAVSPRRVATLGGIALLAPWPVLAVVASSRSVGLTHETASLAQADSDGRRLALVILGLALVAALAGLLLIELERRIVLRVVTRRAIGGAALGLLAAVILLGLVRAGGPISVSERAVSAFKRIHPSAQEHNLNDHLFTFSGTYRAQQWSVAWSAYKTSPVLGTGAGSYERYWEAYEDAPEKLRDAHSLYLETLAELGPVGLGLLLIALGIVVAMGVRGRREPIVPAALAAFVAYAGHAAVDWDWELTGLTLAAFLAGTVGLISRRRSRVRRPPPPVRIGLAALSAVVVVIAGAGYIGNHEQERAQNALDANDPATALAAAETARLWSPWSPYPLTVRGEALLATGDVPGANAAFRDAIALDDDYWRAWLGLAVASKGPARVNALERARTLYPRSTEIDETEQLLAH
jgi:O-antigen ligase